MKLKEIEDTALHLPENERAELAQKLLLSLDERSEEEMKGDWLVEAQLRARDLMKALFDQYRLMRLGAKLKPFCGELRIHPDAETEHLESIALTAEPVFG